MTELVWKSSTPVGIGAIHRFEYGDLTVDATIDLGSQFEGLAELKVTPRTGRIRSQEFQSLPVGRLAHECRARTAAMLRESADIISDSADVYYGEVAAQVARRTSESSQPSTPESSKAHQRRPNHPYTGKAYKEALSDDVDRQPIQAHTDEILSAQRRRDWAEKLTSDPRPGRRGRADESYAQLAADYVAACQTSTTPVKDLADIAHLSPKTIRNHLNAARQRGLLTSAPAGRSGGELTPKAIDLLNEEPET